MKCSVSFFPPFLNSWSPFWEVHLSHFCPTLCICHRDQMCAPKLYNRAGQKWANCQLSYLAQVLVWKQATVTRFSHGNWTYWNHLLEFLKCVKLYPQKAWTSCWTQEVMPPNITLGNYLPVLSVVLAEGVVSTILFSSFLFHALFFSADFRWNGCTQLELLGQPHHTCT